MMGLHLLFQKSLMTISTMVLLLTIPSGEVFAAGAPSDFLPHPSALKEYPYRQGEEKLFGFRWFRRRRRGTTRVPPTRVSPTTPATTTPTPTLTPEVPAEYNELLPFVLASPYQDEAGSCLFMAVTGMAEFFLAKLNPRLSRQGNGPIDLSERYLMNLSISGEENANVRNWKTDTIYHYNNAGHGILNRHYPFTKGYYLAPNNEPVRAANPEEEGVKYGTKFNWISMLDEVTAAGKVSLPKFSRKILFADPASNQWNTGVAPADIALKIKTALREKKAPVMVMYNHFGVWHVNFIVGYNDKISHDCPFVRDFFSQMTEKSAAYFDLAERTGRFSGKKFQKLMNKGQELKTLATKAKKSFLKNGTCSNKGVFYVRDSIYRDNHGPLYDYDKGESGEEDYYARKIIHREYEWAVNLANHVVQISVQE